MRIPDAIVELKPKLPCLPIGLKPRGRKGARVYEPDVMAPQGHPLVRRYIDVLLKIGNRQLLHIPLREHAEASTGIIASLLSVDVDNPLRGP